MSPLTSRRVKRRIYNPEPPRICSRSELAAGKTPRADVNEANPPTLQRIFGDSAIARLLDYLTLYRGLDFPKTEISRNSGVAWKTMWRLWPTIERYGLVKETKRIGKAKMVTLNTDSLIVRALNDLAFQIARHDNQPLQGEERQILVRVKAR